MKKWLWILPTMCLFAFAGVSDAFAQGMGGQDCPPGGGSSSGGCDPGQIGASMGCAWPDCPDMDDIMQASQEDCEEMESMEDMMDDMMDEEECEQYSNAPFGECAEGSDNSWVDQCGN